LSDLHLMASPTDRLHGVDTQATLEAALVGIAALPIEPDFYLITGDLSNDGSLASYQQLRARLAPLLDHRPVLVGLGNHDERPTFRQGWLGEATATDRQARYYYSQRIGPLRVIMLDSVLVDAVPGELDRAQLDWLAAELAEAAPGGTLIALHHPVLARGVRREQDYLLQNAPALAAVLADRPVLGLLSGHLHMASQALFAGTLAATTPAVAFQFDPSIRRSERVLAGTGFTLGSIRDGRLIVNPLLLPGAGAVLRQP
jgi:3',5'-cyclic AMP phosphodiesterase CpdA